MLRQAKDGSVAVDMVKANLAAGGPVYDVILMDFVMYVQTHVSTTPYAYAYAYAHLLT